MGLEGPAHPPRVPRGLARLGFLTAAPAGGSGLRWSGPRGLGRCRVGEGGQLESPAEFRDSPFFSPKPGALLGATAASRPWAVEECHIRTGGAGTKQLPPGTPGVGGETQPPRCEEHRSQAGVSEAPRRGEVGLDQGPSGLPHTYMADVRAPAPHFCSVLASVQGQGCVCTVQPQHGPGSLGFL